MEAEIPGRTEGAAHELLDLEQELAAALEEEDGRVGAVASVDMVAPGKVEASSRAAPAPTISHRQQRRAFER
jgi:hypothetical protein